MANLNLPPNVRLDPNTGLYFITNAQGKTVRVNADTQEQLNQYVTSVNTGVPATITTTDPNTGNPRTRTFDSNAIISERESINRQNELLTAGKRQAGVIGNRDGSYQDLRTGETITKEQAQAKIQAAGLPPETLGAVTPKNSPAYAAAQESINQTATAPSNIPPAESQQPSQSEGGNSTSADATASVPAVTTPVITPTITATPLPPQGALIVEGDLVSNSEPAPVSTGTGFGDDDTSVFPTSPPTDSPAPVSTGTGFGDDDTSVFPTVPPTDSPAPVPGTGFGDDDTSVFPTAFRPTPIDRSNEDEYTTDSLGNSYKVLPDGTTSLYRAAEVEEDITQRDAFKTIANQQGTLRARYVEPSSQDWRVRLVLAGGANYLYQDDNNSLLKPLQDSNGVVFPYTPQISTSYNAAYDETQLTHSNYRGYFYKGSNTGDISITATFTAQDTKEAQYLLAVIHFFRSVTKMFYGQDPNRGTPPPLVYLIGFGEYQFNGHACLVSSFQYNLPADVDYIRATGFNNYGVNLLNRRSQAAQSFPGSSLLGGTARLLASKLLGFPGAEPTRADPGPVTGGVSNTVRSTYVPTKMEIGLTLKPVQSRAQMSREFSLKNFANGNLLKGGYW